MSWRYRTELLINLPLILTDYAAGKLASPK